MIFVADTSSAVCALALLEDSGVVREELFLPARSSDLTERMRAMISSQSLSKVAVTTGPGSFTGLRVGVSFALGLAFGLRVPIVPLRTLELQAARSDMPVTAVVEAGRGRVYYRPPNGEPALGEPAEIPTTHMLVGNVSPKTEAALVGAGHHFRSVPELRKFGEAAALLLKTAREVPYGSLKLEYMQSFSAPK